MFEETSHECPNKHVHGLVKRLAKACRSSSGAQAVIREVESDAFRRHGAYPSEDVEMDLEGAYIPNDKFLEEQHVKEAKDPQEVIHKNPEHSSKESLSE